VAAGGVRLCAGSARRTNENVAPRSCCAVEVKIFFLRAALRQGCTRRPLFLKTRFPVRARFRFHAVGGELISGASGPTLAEESSSGSGARLVAPKSRIRQGTSDSSARSIGNVHWETRQYPKSRATRVGARGRRARGIRFYDWFLLRKCGGSMIVPLPTIYAY
jgi:hypothetical protein